jgi:ABC-2 type transport system ATP-binding protein
VSSHLLSEVEQMCDRVAIIHRGRTLASGTVRELLERSPAGRTRFLARPAEKAAAILAGIPGVSDVRAEDESVVSAAIERAAIPAAIAALVGNGVELSGVERASSTLEEVFLEVTGGETV